MKSKIFLLAFCFPAFASSTLAYQNEAQFDNQPCAESDKPIAQITSRPNFNNKKLLAEKSEGSSDSNKELQKNEKFSVPSPGPMDLTPDKKSKTKKLKIPTTKRDFNKIIDKANKKLKKNPKDAFAYIDLGYAYGNLNQPQKDLEYCNKAIAIDPNIPVSYSERAYAYLCLKQEDKALNDLAKAIELDPKNSAFYATRGWIYGLQKRYNLSIKECTKSISIYDGYSPAFYCRGKAYLYLNQYEKAIANYTKAIQLYPLEDIDYYIERGYAYNCVNKFQKALTDLNTAIKMEPGNYEALLYRSNSLFNLGDYRAAVSNLNEVIRLQPDLGNAYTNRGLAHLKLNSAERAMRDFNKAISLDPKDVSAYKYRGIANLNSGRYQEALHDLTRAVQMKPDTSSYFKLAEVYTKLKQPDKAAEYRVKAINIVASKIKLPKVSTTNDGVPELYRGNSYFPVLLHSSDSYVKHLEDNVDLSKPADNSSPFCYWLLNKDGKELKKLKYITVRPFSEGLAAVTNKERLVGYIDSSGEIVIPATFTAAKRFSNSVAWVNTQEGKMRCIDRSGTPIFADRKLTSVGEFSEGLAAYRFRNDLQKTKNMSIDLWGYINKSGETVISAKYDQALSFANGVAAVKLDGSWMLINKEGIGISEKYDQMKSLFNGYAAIQKEGKWGYIGEDGKLKIALQYEDARLFGSGLAAVKVNSKYGFINEKGEFVIPPNFANAAQFSEGLCAVQPLSSKKWGYIDREGALVIEAKFDGAGAFSEDKALVTNDNKMRFISKDGEDLSFKSYDFIFPYESKSILAMSKNWSHSSMRRMLMSLHLKGFKPQKDTSSATGFYIPIDLEDALEQLDSLLPAKAKADIKTVKIDEMELYQFTGLGFGLRSAWGLRKQSRLSKYFNSIGISRSDNMTATLLRAYWCKLHNQQFNLEKDKVKHSGIDSLKVTKNYSYSKKLVLRSTMEK